MSDDNGQSDAARDDWGLRSDLALLLGVRLPERLDVDGWMARLRENPARNTLALVGLATLAFHAAERGHNPRVRDIFDSLVYVTTNLSVGYSDILAQTTVGKLIGSALMTVGPSLAANFLSGRSRSAGAAPPAPGSPAAIADTQSEVLATLREILAHLKGPAAAGDDVAPSAAPKAP